LWERSAVIFATPQTITNDLIGGKISLKDVSLLVIDEAHRAVGDYDYVFLAKQYMKMAANPRILALTASPGNDKEHINIVCKNLFVEKLEARSEHDTDVKPYVRQKEIERVLVELPESIKEIKNILEAVLRKYLGILKSSGAIDSADLNKIRKRELLQLQGQLAADLSSFEKKIDISNVVLCIKVLHCLELLQTQGIKPLTKFLENLKRQAFRVRAAKNLVNDTEFREAMARVFELESKNIEHPKFAKLTELVTKYAGQKIIIFTQYRNTIEQIINHLSKIKGIRPVKFIGQKEGMSQKKQAETLELFRDEYYNVLVASSIGEEGIHISEANVGIFFEPVPSGLRKVQREGRIGRTNIGKIYVLIAKDTMDEKFYWTAFHKERRMKTAISDLRDDLENPQKRLNLFGT
jgi:Fanconi anemia group M protein